MNNKHWMIYCPGPSLATWSDEQLLAHRNIYEARTIAVNGAWCKAHWAEWWAIQDWELYSECVRSNNLGFDQKMFVPSHWIAHENRWTSEFCEKHGYGVSKFSERPHLCFRKNSLNDLMPFGNTLPWCKYTMFAALALAIMNGANYIELYGADFEGKGYYKEGLENYRTNHEPHRWDNEKHLFEEIKTSSFINHGVVIARKRGSCQNSM